MANCANCGAKWLIGGVTEGEQRFCSKTCYHFWRHPGFCEQCTTVTTEESLGGTYTINLIFGTHLMGFGAKCPTCNSQVKRKWFWFFIPLFPVSAPYRVIYVQPSRWISRKVRVEVG